VRPPAESAADRAGRRLLAACFVADDDEDVAGVHRLIGSCSPGGRSCGGSKPSFDGGSKLATWTTKPEALAGSR
jgi:hypothetical protein